MTDTEESQGKRPRVAGEADPLEGSDEEVEPAAGLREPTPEHKLRNVFENGPRIRMVDTAVEYIHTSDYAIAVDVRSPHEYAEDHIIGAVSTPVLNDEEHKQVGTLYAKSPFEARKLGAALVSRNMHNILLEHFQSFEKNTKVLVYCWRGGERSLSLAHTLSRIGFDVNLLYGGYRAYRTQVRALLDTCGETFKFTVIAGRTGSAKGKLLDALIAAGGQVLDLEGCANHRGSILGQEPATNFQQPSQKMFDSRLFERLSSFDPAKPVFIEGESSRIGIRHVPKSMWTGMKNGVQFELVVPTSCRVAWTRSQYPHYETTHIEKLKGELGTLGKLHPEGHAIAERWIGQADSGNWDALVEDLLVNHYDNAYARAWRRNYGEAGAAPTVIRVPDISDATFADVAKQLVETGTYVGGVSEEDFMEHGVSEKLDADLPERLYIDK